MLALFTALMPVLEGRKPLSAALSAISISTWIEIANALIKEGPAWRSLLSRLHPVFDHIAKDIDGSITEPVIIGNRAHSFLARNAQAAIDVQMSLDDRHPA